MSLRERFEARGFAVKRYAAAYGISHTVLSLVLSEKLNGKNSVNGDVRKAIVQLKGDMVWVGRLPWEV